MWIAIAIGFFAVAAGGWSEPRPVQARAAGCQTTLCYRAPQFYAMNYKRLRLFPRDILISGVNFNHPVDCVAQPTPIQFALRGGAAQDPADKRFASAEWRDIPFFDWLRQSYLFTTRWAGDLIEKTMASSGLGEERLRTAMQGKGSDADTCAMRIGLLRATLAWKGPERTAILRTF